MNPKRKMLIHFLAAIAYRTQKALRDAPESFANYRAQRGVRTPHELLLHMTSVLGYARTFFAGGEWHPIPMPTFGAEVRRFHEVLESLRGDLQSNMSLSEISDEQLLQGPLADAMSHAGQMAMLRRFHGSPVPPENFIFAEIDPDNLGTDQPPPARPDKDWKVADDPAEE